MSANLISSRRGQAVKRALTVPSSLDGYALGAVVLLVIAVGLTLRPSSHAAATYPTTPPAEICGNAGILNGPSTAPAGAVTVAAGNNSSVDFGTANTTYWFAPGTHTLGTGEFGQIDPGNNATFIGAPGAIISGQGDNHSAFDDTSTGVTIEHLTIIDFGTGSSPTNPSGDDNNEGVVNHDAGHNWTIEDNTVEYDAGAGVFVGSGDTVQFNCLTQNGQYGFSAYEPNDVSNVNISNNEISFNDTYNWEAKVDGCGCTGGGKFWRTHGATFNDNYVHDNYSVGMWADTDNTAFDIEGNYIANNYGNGIIYEISYNALIKDNTFIGNAVAQGNTDNSFPYGALYLSESGSDSRVAGNYGTELDVTDNLFQNNWGGVTLWENANRYCASSANSSSGDCTLVNPGVANLTTCANATDLAKTPYINDCRWKTQNVQVTNNIFQMTPSAVSAKCTEANSCGFNGIFSEYGTYPPYTADYVEDNIMYNQNNHFANNTYTGTWYFMAHELGTEVNFSQWQSSPYNQDAGSTLNASGGTPTPTPTPTPTATPSTTPKVGDINGDGSVNIFDLSALLGHWNTTNAASDLNHDGTVNILDLSILLTHWGT